MALVKIHPKPGLNRELTNYANEGAYYNCDKIRFRYGFPQKLGGWVNNNAGATFAGVVRTLFNWVTLDAQKLLAVGTNQRYYIQNQADLNYYAITPITYTATLSLAFTTTNGSSLVTVTDPNFSSTVGSFITIAGASSYTVNGVLLYGAYEILAVLNATQYVIRGSSTATSSGTGGATVNINYELSAGSSTYAATQTGGWGAGGWGTGGWGNNIGGYVPLNLWSQANWGQDLIMAQRAGQIYYWLKNTNDLGYQAYSPAITINSYAGSIQKTSKATTASSNSGTSTITVTDTISIDVGSTVTGAGIPPNTYVSTSWNGSTTIPLTQPLSSTVAQGATISFSYSGQNAPNETNQIVIFSTYQFAVALGATPYDPTTFSPTFNPMLVRWSDQSVPYEWTPTTANQSGEQLLANGSYIVSGVATRQELLIWTDKALYSMQYIGAPFVFNFQTLMDNISIMSPNAMITVNNITYWMGVDKFYAYSGTVQPLVCPVRQYVFANLNMSQSYQVVCGHNEAYSEIWWFYPSTNSQTNDSYVVLNYMDQSWYFGTMNRTAWYDSPFATNPLGAFSIQTSYLTTNLPVGSTVIPMTTSISYPNSGSITIGTETLAYSSNSGGSLTLVNGTATTQQHYQYDKVSYVVPNQILLHEVGTDDGSVSPSIGISAYIETTDFELDSGDHFSYVWRIIPDITFDGSTPNSNPQVTYTLKPRQNPGSSYTYPVDTPVVTSTQLPPTPPSIAPVEQYTGQIYTRVRGRQMAMRVESSQKGTAWQLGVTRVDVRPDGRR